MTATVALKEKARGDDRVCHELGIILLVGRLGRSYGRRRAYNSIQMQKGPRASNGVYRIAWSCERQYIGSTRRIVVTKVKEHKRSCQLIQHEMSAVVEHILTNSNAICCSRRRKL